MYTLSHLRTSVWQGYRWQQKVINPWMRIFLVWRRTEQDFHIFFFKSGANKMENFSNVEYFPPQDWQSLLDTRLDSTMLRPISEQTSANVLPSRFARPEGLQNSPWKYILCSSESYQILSWNWSTKVINAILFGSPINWLCRSISLRFEVFPVRGRHTHSKSPTEQEHFVWKLSCSNYRFLSDWLI